MDERYERARRQVHKVRGFYSHLTTYILVGALLALIDYLPDRGFDWILYPLAGWGIGLAFHAFGVFGVFGRFGSDWEERKIRQYMERDRERERRVSGAALSDAPDAPDAREEYRR